MSKKRNGAAGASPTAPNFGNAPRASHSCSGVARKRPSASTAGSVSPAASVCSIRRANRVRGVDDLVQAAVWSYISQLTLDVVCVDMAPGMTARLKIAASAARAILLLVVISFLALPF